MRSDPTGAGRRRGGRQGNGGLGKSSRSLPSKGLKRGRDNFFEF